MGTIRHLQPPTFPPPSTASTSSSSTSPTLVSRTPATASSTTSATASSTKALNLSKCYSVNSKKKNSNTSTAAEAVTATKKRCYSNMSPSNSSHYECQQHRLRTMLSISFIVLINLMHTALANPVFVDNPILAQSLANSNGAVNAAGTTDSVLTSCIQSGRNIRHLPCIVRKSGNSGVCMFAIDCIKQNGTHLGTCIDRFYFGSCCQLKEDTPAYASEINDNSIDQNTISHFAHESTTLPTSALFKLTTESQSHLHSSSIISETVKNVTQGYLNNNSVSNNNKSTTAPLVTNSKQPTKNSSPKRPPAHTTHKTSQFVVRTTAKPTVAPTTIKPPRRKTTAARPILTTDKTQKVPQYEQRIETTQPPTKFFTFQMVETTTPTATEANNKINDEMPTTHRLPIITTPRSKPKPPTSNSIAPEGTTSIPHTSPPVRSTNRPKPQVTRRPVTTVNKKPTLTKRPTTKPSKRPEFVTTTTIVDTVRPDVANATSPQTLIRKPPPAVTTTNDEIITTTVTEKKPAPTKANTHTTHATHAPRPKPRPTAEVVKVTKPTLVQQPTAAPATTTTTTTTTTVSPSATKATKQPTTQTQSTSPNYTTTPKQKPTTTQTTSTTSTSTHKTSTATATKTPTEAPSIISTIATTVSSTKLKPTTLTTEAPKLPETPLSSSIAAIMTTLKPGLITWTNVDSEPTIMNATDPTDTTDEKWQAHPPPPVSDWVPVPTIEPETGNKTASDAIGLTTTDKPMLVTSTIISVATSVSEIMHNVSALIPKPERPILMTSTMTARPLPTKPKPIITSTSSTTTTATSTTEMPTVELEFSTNSIELNTENIMGTGSDSSTIDYSTEDFNDTVSSVSSTAAPVNTLEGVDYRQVCGRRMFPEPRIVGGSNAAFGRWPWQISLRQWRTSTYLHKCGAALLNENWAITAAHCVDNVPPSDLLLRLGEYDLAEEEEPYGYQERRVQIVASHPQFDPRTFEYDLALLRFYEPVVFQPNIIPVCVPDSDHDFIGQTAFVTGWGRLYEDGPLPSVLQEVAVPVINNTICESMYRSAGYIEHIPHIFICAGWKKGGYDSCEGDSGGPMVLQREEDKRFQLGGVISWGIGCAEVNQPGVYTRISEFRDWINQILQF